MTKWVVLYVLLFTAKVSNAQIKISDGVIDSPVVFNWDVAEEREKQLKVKKLNLYADSLNFYKDGALPSFLVDPCLDWNGYFWEGLHSPVSVRWMVLARVTNKTALKNILASNDKRLKLVCGHQKDKFYPFLTVDMIEQSMYKLIQKRIKQL